MFTTNAILASNRQLGIATLGAALTAGLILITAVLPAEYGIDPTGVGRVLGLTALGETKGTAAPTAAQMPMPAAATALTSLSGAPVAANPVRQDKFAIVLPPGKGIEYKATMAIGETMSFRWSTDQGELYFDFHGDPENAKNGEFESYREGTLKRDSGDFTAKFKGIHGWYWKNQGQDTITVTLETSGNYRQIGKI